MDQTLKNTDKIEYTLAPVDADGNPARVDGVPVWAVESGAATVEPAEDGMSCYLISADEADESVIKVTADADLGEGVRSLEATINLTTIVPEPEAIDLGLTPGTAEAKDEETDPNAPRPDHTLPGDLTPRPDDQPHPDHTLPGDLPGGRRGSVKAGKPQPKRK
jgi:hypothetical protein